MKDCNKCIHKGNGYDDPICLDCESYSDSPNFVKESEATDATETDS